MSQSRRRVWRVAPATLVLVLAFLTLCVLALPAAWLLRRRGEGWPLPVVLAAVGVAGAVYAWRYGLHPRIVATADRLVVLNPFRSHRLEWADLLSVVPGPDGLVLDTPDDTVEAWCLQTPRRASRRAVARAHAVVDALLHHVDAAALAPSGPTVLRRARPVEAATLTAVERTAALAAFGHVFPPDRFPYPDAEVEARWTATLAERRVRVVTASILEQTSAVGAVHGGVDGAVVDAVDGVVVGVVAYDDERVRHLAVLPDHANRGIGGQLLEHACEEIFDDPDRLRAVLWVLEANEVARGFYARRGWRPSDERRQTEFPPHPTEVQLVRPNPRAARRRR